MDAEEREEVLSKRWGAVGLVQTKLADLFAMADAAEKNANILVMEIRGICPQHFSMIAILCLLLLNMTTNKSLFGDTASVEAALEAARNMAN